MPENLRLTQAYQLGELIMSKLLNIALAAALGFAVSAPLYAADTSQASQAKQTTAMSDAEARAATDKCNNLTGTAHAKCIVNIRPAGGGGSSLAVGVGRASAERNTVNESPRVLRRLQSLRRWSHEQIKPFFPGST
jgi:hypothetical protein